MTRVEMDGGPYDGKTMDFGATPPELHLPMKPLIGLETKHESTLDDVNQPLIYAVYRRMPHRGEWGQTMYEHTGNRRNIERF